MSEALKRIEAAMGRLARATPLNSQVLQPIEQELEMGLALAREEWRRLKTVENRLARLEQIGAWHATSPRSRRQGADMTSEIADLRKQVLELSEALRLTKADKEDALARAAVENQRLRDELEGKRESWYTRCLTAQQERDRCRDAKATEVERRHQAEDRATKAEEGLREAVEALAAMLAMFGKPHPEEYIDGAVSPINWPATTVAKARTTLARIKGLLPP